MQVSFVIPAWNEAAELPATLRALHAAAEAVIGREGFEVIVVDDASTDATPDLARAAGVRLVQGECRQISRVRNAGAAAARGDRLVFVDADTTVTPELLRGALQALDADAVGGGARIRFDAQIPWMVRWPTKLFLATMHALGYAGGCFLFMQRADFEAVGGFREDLFASEEIALAAALKKRGRFVVLPIDVVSSARKLVTYSTWEIVSMTTRMVLRGPGALKSRKGLDVWYGERR